MWLHYGKGMIQGWDIVHVQQSCDRGKGLGGDGGEMGVRRRKKEFVGHNKNKQKDRNSLYRGDESHNMSMSMG
jgi:hypothetical protein